MDEQIIQAFDNAILNKNETEFFLIGQKIARIYSYRYFKRFNITCDWELIADEIILSTIEIVKKTQWEKDVNYYWGCIKTGTKFRYLTLRKESNKTISLEAFSTDIHGKSFIDRLELKPVYAERSAAEETALEYARKIMELADQFKSKEEVENEIGIDHKAFLFLCRKYSIQFSNDSLRRFLDAMKIYNIYLATERNLHETKLIVKQRRIKANNRGVLGNIRLAEIYLDIWKDKKNAFINRFILPPNQSSPWDKIG